MDNYAIVQNGLVVSIVIWDGETEWTPGDGAQAVLIPVGLFVDIGFAYDGSRFIAPVVAPIVPTLEQAQASQVAALTAACASAIVSGFLSSALGAPYSYPSKATDQANLNGSVTASLYPNLPAGWTTPFWCADSAGVWAFRDHTASQIQQVGIDGKSAILAAMAKNAMLAEEVAAATTVAAVQSIIWS
jgi:hypothetical protein